CARDAYGSGCDFW
nr:immunoglobulin heavy chain junction region [Macaca mulatta]MOX65364.1 immunoglobulin heavy chain junction region [Macaca mulatta]